MTFIQVWSPLEPMVRAARRYIGGMVRTPFSVAIMTDQRVPITTMKSMADSV